MFFKDSYNFFPLLWFQFAYCVLMRQILFILVFWSSIASAQIGGQTVYGVLDLAGSAHVQALGGTLINRPGADLNFAFENPALLNESMRGKIGLNWSSFYGGVKYGNLSHVMPSKKFGQLGFNLRYINYGSFDQANGLGQITGEFSAGDYVLEAAWSKSLDSNTSIGVKPELVYSYIEQYTSAGLALTLGAYHKTKKGFDLALLVRHMGAQIVAYDKQREPMPFEVLFGIGKSLEHAPFRWSITLHDLNRFDLRYEDPSRVSRDPITGEIIKEEITLGDNLLRHAIFGVEIFPEGNLTARIAYNHQRSREMKIELYGRNVGWSWGMGLKFKRFQLNYSRARYHITGASNHFSLITTLNKLYQ